LEMTPRTIRKRVPSVLNMVGLSGKSKCFPNELSGGEQQRVAIARALVNNPPILICDEPTGNLDAQTSWEIMDILDDVNKKGTTIIMATHAQDIVDKMRKRLVLLERGNILKDTGIRGEE
jgi:cell division transport system ATP-binding protein